MKKNRFQEEQIVSILREAERPGGTVEAVCRAHGISEPTFYRWKKVYGSFGVSEVRRLRQLADENGRLKRLLAERDLEVEALRELLQKKT